MAFTQDNRLMAISTPLGKDVLLLESIQGSEGISRLFSFDLTMLSDNHAVTFDSIIGQSATISIALPSGKKRFFNGIISRFVQGAGGGASGLDARFTHYRATLVPWLWLLTRTANCKIFQKKSVPEIVEEIFNDRRLADFSWNMKKDAYPKRDYCVQYRETDFNFVSRLLEEEGICYYFKHIDGKHTLILGNSPQSHDDCPDQETASYKMTIGGTYDYDVITGIERMQEIRPAKYTLNDYNFETPNTGLKSEVPSQYKLGPGVREIYDYPGSYSTKSEGDRLTNVRMEEEEAQITTVIGTGNCRAFTSGYKFTLTSFYRLDMTDNSLLLTSIMHHAQQGFHEDAVFDYGNSFTCVPSNVPFRPPRVTPKPMVQGAQTAVVVGPPGKEIHVDEHGRVKVQFHWDREGNRDENSSCWMRVSQVSAGAGWGAIDIPRIGHEVIISFLEGDPDRPIITGRVYHGMNRTHTDLPKSGMISGMKSNSTPGGGGSNEMTMDDTKGKEKITIHGQYDMNTTVEHDQANTVNNTFTETIKSDAFITITEGKYNHDVKTGTAAYHVKSNIVENYDDKQTTTVKNDIAIISTGGPIAISSDAKHVYINAATNIQLHVGSSMIWMDSGGQINIKGVNVAINGSASVTIKGGIVHSEADSEHQTKGAIVISEGAATNTVKGGMVMLNP